MLFKTSGAAGALKSPDAMSEFNGDMRGAGQDAPENTPAESGDGSFFIPSDIFKGMNYKPGDKIELEVVGKDEDGDLEVKLSGSGQGDDWRSDLHQTLTESGQAGDEGGGQ